MTVPKELIDARVPTPADLAEFVQAMRDSNKWSQATLAEISRVTERTIQRVENGEPSSLDTRRALARAFGHDDVDLFEKPWPFTNPEKVKAYIAELDETTLKIALTPIKEGRTLRTMLEGAESFATDEIGELTKEAREAFASLADYLRDYQNISDECSMSQKLGVDRDIDDLLQTITEQGATVGAGFRHARLRMKPDPPDKSDMDWTNIHIVIAPKEAFPSGIRVPKRVRFT